MNDHQQLWQDCERHSKAVLDSLEQLVTIAGRNEEGYRLVQKQLADLRKASDMTLDLIVELLKKRPILKAVS